MPQEWAGLVLQGAGLVPQGEQLCWIEPPMPQEWAGLVPQGEGLGS